MQPRRDLERSAQQCERSGVRSGGAAAPTGQGSARELHRRSSAGQAPDAAAGALGLVHGRVGQLDQPLVVGADLGAEGDADASHRSTTSTGVVGTVEIDRPERRPGRPARASGCASGGSAIGSAERLDESLGDGDGLLRGRGGGSR